MRVRQCVLPAAECIVLLFQSNFSLLDLNHLPGQILGFPADRRSEGLVNTHACTNQRDEKSIRLRKQKKTGVNKNNPVSIFSGKEAER